MSTDPDPMDGEGGKCTQPDAQSPADKESPAEDALPVDATGDSEPTASSPPASAAAASCPRPDAQKDSTDMDIDNDLTTNERMPTMDELEQPKEDKPQPPEVKEEQAQGQAQVQDVDVDEEKPLEQPTARPPSPPPAIKIEDDDKPLKSQEEIPPSSPEAPLNPSPRPAGKITRSSLNGTGHQVNTRTPAIMKRLRKSTRFKAKQTGKGAHGGGGGSNSQSNGHSHGPNGSAGSSTHLASAGAHPSNSNKHGKSGPAGGPGGGAPGSRSRRTLFKRPAQKTPKVQACTRFVKSVFYKGSYMQIGDIVSIVDGEQNLYYAQVRGLLVDAYCEKSAFLTWLIPTQDSPDPQEGFDPATYLIGPDEELSRKLCYLEFVMHAPSNYYFDRSTPFPLPDVDEYTAQRAGGYIWTRLPVVKRERGSGHKAGGAS
ncbi:GATA zinc finger domain-containing protein 1 [Drosophila biarmipes]|uniref:GATA zinc finger domain-containing protein 1 n=1 Tax=Drosophila biarmipes TaxID=125945 RepID=UPI0007E848DE|nr:GATA zinc finger domain-containing protein 1 [Drosophila biarmipes]